MSQYETEKSPAGSAGNIENNYKYNDAKLHKSKKARFFWKRAFDCLLLSLEIDFLTAKKLCIRTGKKYN